MASLAPGHSFQYYRQVIITVPILTPLVVIPAILMVKFVCGCIHSSHSQILSKLAEKFSFGEEKKYYLQQEKPSKCIFVLLVIKGMLLLMFSIAVFLNDSVIAHEVGCLSGHWDCFTLTRRRAIRIANCSNLGRFSDDSIQCYRPAFEYSTALSDVGGIVFVTHIIINVYIAIYFSTASITNRCLRITSAFFVNFAFSILAFVAPISFAIFHTPRRTAETLNFKMNNVIVAVYYSLIYIVVTLAMLVRSKCTFDDFDTDYDPNNIVITVDRPTGANGTTKVGGAVGGTPPRASIQIAQGNKIHTINVT